MRRAWLLSVVVAAVITLLSGAAAAQTAIPATLTLQPTVLWAGETATATVTLTQRL